MPNNAQTPGYQSVREHPAGPRRDLQESSSTISSRAGRETPRLGLPDKPHLTHLQARRVSGASVFSECRGPGRSPLTLRTNWAARRRSRPRVRRLFSRLGFRFFSVRSGPKTLPSVHKQRKRRVKSKVPPGQGHIPPPPGVEQPADTAPERRNAFHGTIESTRSSQLCGSSPPSGSCRPHLPSTVGGGAEDRLASSVHCRKHSKHPPACRLVPGRRLAPDATSLSEKSANLTIDLPVHGP